MIMNDGSRRGWLRPFGDTGITGSGICMGGAQLCSMPVLFGYDLTEEAAVDLDRQVMHGPIDFLDTANGYGAGRSEERLGSAIRAHRACRATSSSRPRASKTPRRRSGA